MTTLPDSDERDDYCGVMARDTGNARFFIVLALALAATAAAMWCYAERIPTERPIAIEDISYAN